MNLHTSTRPLWIRCTALTLATLLAAGCSVLEEDKVDYRSAKKASTLDIPPDLTQLSRDSRYVAPGVAVTANSYQATQQTAGASDGAATAAVSVGDVRIERSGNQRWLVVNRPADKLWAPIHDFWQDSGFLLVLDDQKLGIMETDWAENRAKLPQDFIRATIGKVFDSLYSTGERDKFRTRLERNANGGTEIYITHRGMAEVYTADQRGDTVWQPRPADPELETEFLRRLMVKLGVTQEQSKAQVASQAAPSVAKVAQVNNQSVLQLNDGFDRAWRRVGVALDRTSFTVEDRDRSQGIYFVRYVSAEDSANASKPGFFSRLFGAKDKEATPVRYRVQVKSTDSQTTVSVLNAQGQPEDSPNTKRIIQLLANDMK